MADANKLDVNKGLDELRKSRPARGGRGGGRRGGFGGGRGNGAPGGGRGGFGRRSGGGFGRRPAGGSIQKRRSGGPGLNNSFSPNKAAAAAVCSLKNFS